MHTQAQVAQRQHRLAHVVHQIARVMHVHVRRLAIGDDDDGASLDRGAQRQRASVAQRRAQARGVASPRGADPAQRRCLQFAMGGISSADAQAILEASLVALEDLLGEEPRLTYRFLRYANSAHFGARREIRLGIEKARDKLRQL